MRSRIVSYAFFAAYPFTCVCVSRNPLSIRLSPISISEIYENASVDKAAVRKISSGTCSASFSALLCFSSDATDLHGICIPADKI